VGSVDNAVMLHSRLQPGMRLPQILKLTRSLGHQQGSGAEETFVWVDAGGDSVQVRLHDGRLAAWTLQRAGGETPAATSGPSAPGT